MNDHSNNLVCFYCKKNPGDGNPGECEMYRMYDFSVLVGTKQTYQVKNIPIERCTNCEKKQFITMSSIWILSLVFGIMIVVILWEVMSFFSLLIGFFVFSLSVRIIRFVLQFVIPDFFDNSYKVRKHPIVIEHLSNRWKKGDGPMTTVEGVMSNEKQREEKIYKDFY